MLHGRGRHLGAKPEPAGGLDAVDMDRLFISAQDGLDHIVNVRQGGADEPVRFRAFSSRHR